MARLIEGETIYRVIFNNGRVIDLEAMGLQWSHEGGRLVVQLLRRPTKEDGRTIAGIFADTNIVGIVQKDTIVAQS